MKSFLLLCICVFAGINVHAQEYDSLLNSRKGSFYNYIYEISHENALAYLQAQAYFAQKGKRKTIDTKEIIAAGKLVDSFPSHQKIERVLPTGYYLFVYAYEHKLRSSVEIVMPYQVHILNNKTDFQAVIHEEAGKPITEADVRLKNHKISFNPKSQSYKINKNNRKGLLTVTHGGFTSYHQINRAYNNSRLRRIGNKILWFPPVRIVSYPVRLLVDIVRSIKKHSPQGTVLGIVRIFDKYNYEKRHNYRRELRREKQTYITLNQPMYRPKDTIKLKAVVLDRKGKPYQKPLQLVLERSYIDFVKLAILKPNDLGAYTFELPLSDTLKLKMGGGYNLILQEIEKEKEKIDNVYFKYEDYELKNNTYSLKMYDAGKAIEAKENSYRYGERPIFRKGETIAFWARGKDANGMNVLDARLKLYLTTPSAQAVAGKTTFVKDTLWHKELTLDPLGETKIVLPDSLLPDASMHVNVLAVFTNSNQERAERSMEFEYLLDKDTDNLVAYEVREDSIFIQSKRPSAGKEAILLTQIGEPKKVIQKNIQLPYAEKINPLVHYYSVKQGKDEVFCKEYMDAKPMLMPYSHRDKDSVWIGINNPRNLTFWYTLYCKNRVIKRGKDTQLAYQTRANTRQMYALSVQYIWQGKSVTENFSVGFEDYALKLEVKQPAQVYPGQKTKIDIQVKDAKDRPVPDADLTAYALTSKFPDIKTPEMPAFSKRKKGRKAYNSFSESVGKLPNRDEILDWEHYRRKMNLDSIELYKMIYPKTGKYEHYIKTNDTIAEIAVHATSAEGFQKVYWVDIDEYPAYFECAGAGKPYSIPLSAGYHTITFRTAYQYIEVKRVLAVKGTKLILNINTSIGTGKLQYDGFTVQNAQSKYEQYEKIKIWQHLMPYQNNMEGITYLTQAGESKILFPTQYNTQHYLYPIKPNAVEIHNLDFKNKETSYKFNFEPLYQYALPEHKDFNAIKMKTWKAEILDKPLFSNYDYAPKNFYERYQNDVQILKHWQSAMPNLQGTVYYFDDYRSEAGKCKVVLAPKDSLLKYPFRYCALESEKRDIFRVYSADNYRFENLPVGKFTLFFITESGTYITQKFETISRNGTHFIYLPTPLKPLPADSISQRIITAYSKAIEKLEPKVTRTFEYRKTTQSYNPYSYTVRGRVTDRENAGMPGAAVIVLGTSFGTSTDDEGYYSINAPLDATLIFTMVGYEEVNVSVRGASNIDVMLKEGVMLDNVIVTGYREVERDHFTGSSATISAKYINQVPIASFDQILQGRAAGIAIGSGMPGAASQVMIRGAGSINSGTEPLYIVDGVAISASEFAQLNPSEIGGITVLKDEKASIYGSRGVNGVLIITTKKQGGTKLPAEEPISESTLSPQGGNSLRRNFSDNAYWQPRLRTDRAGKASFEVTFPDDITNWRTIVLAHTAHKQTGKSVGNIKSLKSIVGELAIPRFLVEGDTVRILGKVLNYTQDTLKVKTSFSINGKAGKSTQYDKMRHSAIDSLVLVAEKQDRDSLQVQYEIETANGYRDGELRNIPLYPQGSEEAKGQFLVLRKDTTITLDIAPEKTSVEIYAYTHHLDWVLEESGKLRDYKYYCNEQLASKIQGLLAERQIQKYFNKPFSHEKELQNHITELCKRQGKDGQWGWWQDTQATPWITLHVLRVLIEAQKQGFEIPLKSMETVAQVLRFELEKESKDFNETFQKIQILQNLKASVKTEPILAYWSDTTRFKYLNTTQKFILWQHQAKENPTKVLDSLLKYEQKTTFGGTYFHKPQQNLYDNHIQATLLAYQILKSIGGQESRLEKIRDFFVAERGNLAPRNTYETASALSVILPDMLANGGGLTKTTMRLEGIANEDVTAFPYSLTVQKAGKLTLHKKGDYPLYLSISEKFWNPKPLQAEKIFKITTNFADSTLRAGKPNTLTAEVQVLEKADYTMIEIPIPAGCSYQSKDKFWSNYEIYREYFREKVCIYCQNLPVGKYTYKVELLPRYSGSYTLNPARAEMMYFPTFFGRNVSKRVKVVDLR